LIPHLFDINEGVWANVTLRMGEPTRSLNVLAVVISYRAILLHRKEKEESSGILLNQRIILNDRIIDKMGIGDWRCSAQFRFEILLL
jgi:hypothetical protein